MGDLNFVAFDFPAAEFAIHGVKIDPVAAGNHRQRFLKIHPQFVRRARFAGIIPGGDEPPAQGATARFEPADVIALPAMERDRHSTEDFERGVHIHAKGGAAFAGEAERFFNSFHDVHYSNLRPGPEKRNTLTWVCFLSEINVFQGKLPTGPPSDQNYFIFTISPLSGTPGFVSHS